MTPFEYNPEFDAQLIQGRCIKCGTHCYARRDAFNFLCDPCVAKAKEKAKIEREGIKIINKKNNNV